MSDATGADAASRIGADGRRVDAVTAQVETLVIGAGYAGLAAALHLAEQGRSVAPPPARATDTDPWELGDELVEEEDFSQAEVW